MLRVAILAAVAALALVGGANAFVVVAAPGTRSAGEAPRADAALVLGALVHDDGRLSSMLDDRVRTAAALHRAGKVPRILVSADNGQRSYDEVNPMKERLLELGVPARDVFTDHAGFDTWDSAQRARKVFGARRVLVVTQGFHMARALYAAERAGLEATGVVADRAGGYGKVMPRLHAREVAARVKAFADGVTGADPKFLGPPIPLSGDGRSSWGP